MARLFQRRRHIRAGATYPGPFYFTLLEAARNSTPTPTEQMTRRARFLADLRSIDPTDPLKDN